jgi:subtilisin family serine protease
VGLQCAVLEYPPTGPYPHAVHRILRSSRLAVVVLVTSLVTGSAMVSGAAASPASNKAKSPAASVASADNGLGTPVSSAATPAKKASTPGSAQTAGAQANAASASACLRAASKSSGDQTADYIIRFRPGSDAAAEASAVRAVQASVKHEFTSVLQGVAASLTADQVECLSARAGVEAIEPDVAMATTDTQNKAPWGLDRIDQRTLPLSGTFTWSTGAATVQAYVVDTGVLASHNDFTGRVRGGFTAIKDGRGTSDCNGHGTHVAGSIGGAVHGVAKSVSLVPVRVLDCKGSGTSSGVIAGLDWISANGVKPAVVNMSLGGGASSALDTAVSNLIGKGFTVVVAAGNSSANACNYSPSRVPAAVTVGSSDSLDRVSSFSNVGPCLDLFGPGTSILSTWHTSNTATNTISGTSMAAPHIAGIAAAVLAVDPTLSPGAVAQALTSHASVGVLSGVNSTTVNLLGFLAVTTSDIGTDPGSGNDPVNASAPAAVTDLSGAAGRKSVTLGWTIPNNGGSAITAQEVTMRWGISTRVYSVSATATSVKITGLTAGVEYSFTVHAVNEVGPGLESNTVKAVPLR